VPETGIALAVLLFVWAPDGLERNGRLGRDFANGSQTEVPAAAKLHHNGPEDWPSGKFGSKIGLGASFEP